MEIETLEMAGLVSALKALRLSYGKEPRSECGANCWEDDDGDLCGGWCVKADERVNDAHRLQGIAGRGVAEGEGWDQHGEGTGEGGFLLVSVFEEYLEAEEESQAPRVARVLQVGRVTSVRRGVHNGGCGRNGIRFNI